MPYALQIAKVGKLVIALLTRVRLELSSDLQSLNNLCTMSSDIIAKSADITT